jgi:hypothetical protein
MATVDHVIRAEELMAYLDSELPPERRAAVAEHLPSCRTCQGLVAAFEETSRSVAGWQVAPPARELRAPAVPAATDTPRRAPLFSWHNRAAVLTLGMLSAAAIAVTLFVPALRRPATTFARSSPAAVSRTDPATPVARATELDARVEGGGGHALVQSDAPSGPKIVRAVSLTVIAKEFDAVRPAIDRVLKDVGGFVGEMQLTDASSTERSLRATLRIPSSRLDEAVRALRTVGRVIDESHSGEDVTEQVMDLEARLANARNTEKRLNDVLLNRTGKVGDVLEVERELARVRGEIEQLDAQRVNLKRRVTYATVTVQVHEPRKASLEISPQPLSARFRNAFIDGIRDALDMTAAILLWILRVVPTLLVWLAIAWWPVRALQRAYRIRSSSNA